MLPLFKTPDLTIFCGRLLAAGMRACADLAEQARARRDEPAAQAAAAAADGLAAWAGQVPGAPFTDHPFVATIPAERATWDAERTRLAGSQRPRRLARGRASLAGPGLPAPRRVRLVAAGPGPAGRRSAGRRGRRRAAGRRGRCRRARAFAGPDSPLAERARIPLQTPAAAVPQTPRPAAPPAPYGLTGRELAVLRLLAAGRTNAQIGAELYISPRTAGVHVTNILRKLGVSGRVQAAAQAERAGLLPAPQP